MGSGPRGRDVRDAQLGGQPSYFAGAHVMTARNALDRPPAVYPKGADGIPGARIDTP